MNLAELCAYSNGRRTVTTHHLQHDQVIATAIFTDGTTFTGIYIAGSGHWLDLPEKVEVGYGSDIMVNGVQKKAIHFDIWCSPAPTYGGMRVTGA